MLGISVCLGVHRSDPLPELEKKIKIKYCSRKAFSRAYKEAQR